VQASISESMAYFCPLAGAMGFVENEHGSAAERTEPGQVPLPEGPEGEGVGSG